MEDLKASRLAHGALHCDKERVTMQPFKKLVEIQPKIQPVLSITYERVSACLLSYTPDSPSLTSIPRSFSDVLGTKAVDYQQLLECLELEEGLEDLPGLADDDWTAGFLNISPCTVLTYNPYLPELKVFDLTDHEKLATSLATQTSPQTRNVDKDLDQLLSACALPIESMYESYDEWWKNDAWCDWNERRFEQGSMSQVTWITNFSITRRATDDV
jgi:hypothetical protein